MELMEFDLPPEPETAPPVPKPVAASPAAKPTATHSGVELLQAVRALLADPNKWSRHPLAELDNGKSCWDNNPAAVKWGLIGALAVVKRWPFPMEEPYHWILTTLGHNVPKYDPMRHNGILDAFNKETTHENLLSVLDRALELGSAIEAGL